LAEAFASAAGITKIALNRMVKIFFII